MTFQVLYSRLGIVNRVSYTNCIALAIGGFLGPCYDHFLGCYWVAIVPIEELDKKLVQLKSEFASKHKEPALKGE